MENNRTDKGTFLPGNIGKPKGALNKLNRERKEKIEKVPGAADNMVEDALRQLKHKELPDIWVGLTEYVCPKLNPSCITKFATI